MNNQDVLKEPKLVSLSTDTQLNVILITLDDFSFELFSENLDSLPNLKALKSQSASFDNAFSIGPTTFFSFPGIIASVYPYHFGIGIDKSSRAIDEVLKCYGYNTAQINECNVLLTPYFGYGLHTDYQKHILNLPESEVSNRIEDALLRGGDVATAKRHLWRPYPLLGIILKLRPIWTRSERVKSLGVYLLNALRFLRLYLRGRGITLERRRKLYHLFRDEVVGFINEGFKRPQLLWIHTVINHLPYLPLEDGSAFSEKQVNYLNTRAVSRFLNYKICTKLKRLYIESLKMTDTFIGDIFQALRTSSLLESSIIVITADHGEEFMEDGYFGHDQQSSSDRLLHVPLLFYCPGVIKPKSVSTPVSTIDILPTICDLLNIKIPDTNRGVSLKEILLQCERDQQDCLHFSERPLFSEAWYPKSLLDRSAGCESTKRVFSVRKGVYKLRVTQEQITEDTVSEKHELVNWINNEKLSVNSNSQIVEDLKCLLNNHIYHEGILAGYLRRDAERERVRGALGRLKSRPQA